MDMDSSALSELKSCLPLRGLVAKCYRVLEFASISKNFEQKPSLRKSSSREAIGL